MTLKYTVKTNVVFLFLQNIYTVGRSLQSPSVLLEPEPTGNGKQTAKISSIFLSTTLLANIIRYTAGSITVAW
jgi:hypothetical protein